MRFPTRSSALAYLELLADNPNVTWFDATDLPARNARADEVICKASCALARWMCERTPGSNKAECARQYRDCLAGCE